MSEQGWRLKNPISAEVLQECFRTNLPRFEIPDIDLCGWRAEFFNEQAKSIGLPAEGKHAEKHARLFLKHLPSGGDGFAAAARKSVSIWLQSNSKPDWEDLACLICALAMGDCKTPDGRFPKSVNPGDPLCKFTQSVLDHMGNIKTTDNSVSEALRHRSGRNAKTKGKMSLKIPLPQRASVPHTSPHTDTKPESGP
jgi:hypothetical protein